MTTDVGEDLGTETKLADGLAVETRLFRSSGGGELDVLDTEGIESVSNSDLSLGVEESIGELFALWIQEWEMTQLDRQNVETRLFYPPLSVLSIMLKLQMFERRSDARAAYGFLGSLLR